jgi:trimethylamine--corrinoid protein Co-methyltransferase
MAMSLQSNYVELNTPQFKKFSKDQLERLHNASLEILDRTGARLDDQEAIDLFKKAGAKVINENEVHIPSNLVEWGLSIAPKRVVLCERHGRRVMPLERNNVFFGPGSDCLNILDHRTGERRPGTLQDIVDGIRVCDALPNIDFLMSMFVASDIHEQGVADRHQMRAMLMNSTKPILFVTTEFEGCVDVVRMAEAVVGGEEELQSNPICACYINVSSPLHHNAESLQKLLFLAGKRLPATYSPVVLRGMNGPITAAGAIALANAGELVGLVLAQLKREGAPIIHSGGYHDLFDMRTMVGIYESPEGRNGRAELAHYYGLPVFGLAGASDSKLPDQQAAAEASLSMLIEALYGVNLIHDVGYLESGKCNSLEQLVICDEIINYIKRFMQGVEVSEETLALDLIHKLGPQGDFLSTKHTRKHYSEDWYPKLFDRATYESWKSAGGKSLRESANERIESILKNHHPEPLPDEIQQAVDLIVSEAGG